MSSLKKFEKATIPADKLGKHAGSSFTVKIVAEMGGSVIGRETVSGGLFEIGVDKTILNIGDIVVYDGAGLVTSHERPTKEAKEAAPQTVTVQPSREGSNHIPRNC